MSTESTSSWEKEGGLGGGGGGGGTYERKSSRSGVIGTEFTNNKLPIAAAPGGELQWAIKVFKWIKHID